MPQLDVTVYFSELCVITIILLGIYFSIKISLFPNSDILLVSELTEMGLVFVGLITRARNIFVLSADNSTFGKGDERSKYVIVYSNENK